MRHPSRSGSGSPTPPHFMSRTKATAPTPTARGRGRIRRPPHRPRQDCRNGSLTARLCLESGLRPLGRIGARRALYRRRAIPPAIIRRRTCRGACHRRPAQHHRPRQRDGTVTIWAITSTVERQRRPRRRSEQAGHYHRPVGRRPACRQTKASPPSGRRALAKCSAAFPYAGNRCDAITRLRRRHVDMGDMILRVVRQHVLSSMLSIDAADRSFTVLSVVVTIYTPASSRLRWKNTYFWRRPGRAKSSARDSTAPSACDGLAPAVAQEPVLADKFAVNVHNISLTGDIKVKQFVGCIGS